MAKKAVKRTKSRTMSAKKRSVKRKSTFPAKAAARKKSAKPTKTTAAKTPAKKRRPKRNLFQSLAALVRSE